MCFTLREEIRLLLIAMLLLIDIDRVGDRCEYFVIYFKTMFDQLMILEVSHLALYMHAYLINFI